MDHIEMNKQTGNNDTYKKKISVYIHVVKKFYQYKAWVSIIQEIHWDSACLHSVLDERSAAS